MGKLEVISIQGQTAVTADTVSQKLRSPLRQFEDTSIHTLRDTVHTHKCCPALDISEMTLGGSGGGGGGGGGQGLTGSRYPTRPELFFKSPTRPDPKIENDWVPGN